MPGPGGRRPGGPGGMRGPGGPGRMGGPRMGHRPPPPPPPPPPHGGPRGHRGYRYGGCCLTGCLTYVLGAASVLALIIAAIAALI